MKQLPKLVFSFWLVSAWASASTPVIISGAWSKHQTIESITTENTWDFSNGAETLRITAPPAPFSSAKVGHWMDVETRQTPSGVTRTIRWFKDEHSQPNSLLIQNSTFVGEAIPGWRWNGNLSLSNQRQQNRTLKVGKVSYINGWCVLITEVRPAITRKSGIAHESETRFDGWVQHNPKVCIAK